jgi:hypothetical protein
MSPASIRGARFAPGTAGDRHAGAAREGRRLPVDRAARGLELLFQLLVFAAQPLAFRFRPTQVLAQPLDLPALHLDDLLRLVSGPTPVVLRHAPVMPDSRTQYKRKLRVSTH